ncbi:ribosomal L1 domain-containing protein 1-like [Salvia hispanica]|uniref:ribosomal L1 domain-containing protein 1-like n=1 Tax=Salvia hispanica TaxID=49212 RepID=UPI0020097EC8|nr:ribosomal L1 domain-containing protein 1-like [Salvia hispanica]
MAAPSRERINEDGVRKATNALLKWKKKSLLSHSHDGNAANEEEADDFIYLSVTLKKVPPRNLSAAPHQILLRRSLLSQDYTASNICLIVDGKRITAESAQKILLAKGIPFVKKVFKLGKLKSDYDSFESKKKLFDSFDLFLADKSVEAVLPKVLGRVFYKKRKKIPVAVDLRGDWKEELERACRSSLWCLSGGTCSSVRVGRLGEMESGEIVENVLDAVDGVVGILPRKWGGIRCLHLKLSDSLALPIYEDEVSVSDGKLGSSLVKRK